MNTPKSGRVNEGDDSFVVNSWKMNHHTDYRQGIDLPIPREQWNKLKEVEKIAGGILKKIEIVDKASLEPRSNYKHRKKICCS